MLRHPCFDETAHRIVGRVHLPVAPKCNIRCAYCEPKIGCVNERRPGVSAVIIPASEAVDYVKMALTFEPRIEVVGIAGPGDPLANEETFETLFSIRKHFPELKLCLATNGLLLPEKLPMLIKAGINFLTVTVNFINPEVGAKIVRFVKNKKLLMGVEGAKLLVSRQLEGIAMASEAGIRVKVNTVFIPEVNDKEIPEIARVVSFMGASLMNIIPLIPLGDFKGHRAPTTEEIEEARRLAGRFIKQFTLCKRCRADALGVPGDGDTTLCAVCA
ncbi:MAG: radical SAM protein [Thermodesulfobacteria bacterium]|nr:radical SAM protein [Thermodesulfobacteriota bacterium]